jgi:hypothetical protein
VRLGDLGLRASEFSTGRLVLVLDLRNPAQLKKQGSARRQKEASKTTLTAFVGLTAALLQFLTAVLPVLFKEI